MVRTIRPLALYDIVVVCLQYPSEDYNQVYMKD